MLIMFKRVVLNHIHALYIVIIMNEYCVVSLDIDVEMSRLRTPHRRGV